MCNIESIFFLGILALTIDGIEPAFSTSAIARGRSSSVGELSRNIDIKPFERTQPSTSVASSSSTIHEAESRPSASASNFREIDLQEHQHLVVKPKRVSFAAAVDLTDASVATHRGREQLDPTRDGVFARVHRILFQNVAPVAVGAVVGIGGYEVIKSNINRTTLPPTTTIKTPVSNSSNDVNELLIVFN